MVGILIVTHGEFSKGIVDGMELICGHQEQLDTMSLRIEDDVEVFAEEVKARAQALNTGDGVLVLVDFLGGSPANVTFRALATEEYMEGVAGVNFPMLLEAVNSRDFMDLQELTETCCAIGSMGIINIRDRMKEIAADDDEDD